MRKVASVQADDIEKISLPVISDLQRTDLYILKLTEHPTAILVLCPGFNENGKDWLEKRYADQSPAVPIVQHARRILRKDSAAADRLLVDLLEKTFPDLPKNPARFRELLVEETNRVEGKLTNDTLKAAHALAMARWKSECKG